MQNTGWVRKLDTRVAMLTSTYERQTVFQVGVHVDVTKTCGPRPNRVGADLRYWKLARFRASITEPPPPTQQLVCLVTFQIHTKPQSRPVRRKPPFLSYLEIYRQIVTCFVGYSIDELCLAIY